MKAFLLLALVSIASVTHSQSADSLTVPVHGYAEKPKEGIYFSGPQEKKFSLKLSFLSGDYRSDSFCLPEEYSTQAGVVTNSGYSFTPSGSFDKYYFNDLAFKKKMLECDPSVAHMIGAYKGAELLKGIRCSMPRESAAMSVLKTCLVAAETAATAAVLVTHLQKYGKKYVK